MRAMILIVTVVFGVLAIAGCEKTIKEGVNRTAIGAP
jgi:hypothetical protein